jgi:hypothetical protein
MTIENGLSAVFRRLIRINRFGLGDDGRRVHDALFRTLTHSG